MAVLLFMTLLAVALIKMNRGVYEQIDALATANSDSVQWSLAQSDVELLALVNAISEALRDNASSVAPVRTRFDVFYSRAQTLATSPLLTELREDAAVVGALKRIEAYLDDTVTLIDSDDAVLRNGLPKLSVDTAALRRHVRDINLKGIAVLSQVSDDQRKSIATTLTLVSYLALALFCVLILAALLLLFFLRQERTRAREQHQMRSRLSAMVSSSLDAVIAVDKKGTVIDYNGAAEGIFGYARDEAIGAKMEDLIVPDHLKEAHRSGMDRYARTGEKHVIGKGRVQLEAKDKDGRVFPVELSIASSDSEEGEIFVSFLRDISRRVAAEQALIKARDDAVAGEKAKADFIAVMSHEMRTPLNGMLGTLELFNFEEQTPKDREYLEIIKASGKLLLHHVDNVLEISRAEAGKIELSERVFSVPALVRELVESQRGVSEHRGNSLTKMIDLDGGDYAVGDPTRIRQILLNLIGNAIKFTRNGSITVEARRMPNDDVVEFRVTDTGIGISAGDRERIFEDFVTLDPTFTRAVGGTGLGLAIVRRLVNAMGGTIGLESSSGYGSSFWVRLPLLLSQENTAQKPEATHETFHEADPVIDPMKILLVEDNRINRIVARGLLEKDGHRVDEAHNGEQGVEKAASDTYDLVLMDISMPVMDGIEATRAIRKAEHAGTHLPIVALTANAIPSERDRFLAAGLDDILVKPITLSGLRQVLRQYSTGRRVSRNGNAEEADVFDAVVNHGHLEELAAALGKDKVDGLIRAVLSEAGLAMHAIAQKLDARGTDDDLKEMVHHSAGSAALLGAEALRGVLVGIEDTILEEVEFSGSEQSSLLSVWSKTVPELKLHLIGKEG